VISSPRPDGRSADDDCLLCPTLRFWFNQMAGLPGLDSLLWADEDVYVAPDLAPVAEGHLLVVTNRHYQCAGACPRRIWPAIALARRRVKALYQEAYGAEALIFEHGPARSQAAGSCIDHAHLHCIPATIELGPVVESHGLRGFTATYETLESLWNAGLSYLYLEEGSSGRAFLAEELPTQFLRNAAVVAVAGEDARRQPTQWRWQETCGLPVSKRRFVRTLERLRPLSDMAQPHATESHQ